MQKLIKENQILKGQLERLKNTLKDMQEFNLLVLNQEKNDRERAFIESKILVYGKLLEIINGSAGNEQ